MRHDKKNLLDAIRVIVNAAEDIADHWDKEQYREISRDVVCFVDRRVGRQAATCPGAGRRGKFPRKSFLPPMTREKILTAILLVTRTGIEIVQDYQGGDYPGMAKDIVKLAKRITAATQG